MRTSYEVAHVIRALGHEAEQKHFSTHQLRHLRAIKECRTAALGGHVDACTNCGSIRLSYNSCRNRHCPKCQGHKRHEWIAKREAELLPVPYFHVVFTLPQELNALAMHAPAIIYSALFTATWQTLQAFGAKQNMQLGMISVLHTWGQNLTLHPHLHCIVPGAGVDKNHRLKHIRADGKYLFPVKAMSKIFRAKYVAILRANKLGDKELFDTLFSKPWVVYAKRPFGNTRSVIEYLGRYTHKVAISNARIKNVNATHTTFEYKDYKKGATKKVMELTNQEFVRRFAMHIMPHRFVRIRQYGILSSTWKRNKLQALQEQHNVVPHNIAKQKVQCQLHQCPHCKQQTMVTILTFDKRGPPKEWIMGTQNFSY